MRLRKRQASNKVNESKGEPGRPRKNKVTRESNRGQIKANESKEVQESNRDQGIAKEIKREQARLMESNVRAKESKGVQWRVRESNREPQRAK